MINENKNIRISLTHSKKGIKIVVGDEVYLTDVNSVQRVINGEIFVINANNFTYGED